MKTAPYNDLPQISAADAPVAYRWDDKVRRRYGNTLLAPLVIRSERIDPAKMAALIGRGSRLPGNFENLFCDNQPDALRVRAIAIDGFVWVPAEPPRYVVMAAGKGGNHAGTYLFVHGFTNEDIPAERVFAADALQDAISAAEQIAVARGDTKSLPIVPSSVIQVCDRHDLRPMAALGRRAPAGAASSFFAAGRELS